jgi:3-deoxy-D-manno-octulosonic-acid transferase
MGQIIYNSLSFFGHLLLRPLQWVGSEKLRAFWDGRDNAWNQLKGLDPVGQNRLWMHCASLGEFEQGRPILEWMRQKYPQHQIVLSFFSPSGFAPKQKTPLADLVVYLPWDTPSNAKKFIQTIAPSAAYIVKSDLWPNYLIQLQKQNIPTYVIAARFKQKHWIFGPAGGFMRKHLKSLTHIFVQDQQSLDLLKTHGINHCSVSGDTRFDRVWAQSKQDNSLDFLEVFKRDEPCVILGSTWPEDHDLWVSAINELTPTGVRFIIAPHDLNPQEIQRLQGKISAPCAIYKGAIIPELSSASVLIINTIGHLSRSYASADLAYVGGGMGDSGLHNILEPAAFGLPIFIGPIHEKFPEAKDLIALGGVQVVKRKEEVLELLQQWADNPFKFQSMGEINRDYIQRQAGATAHIINTLDSVE